MIIPGTKYKITRDIKSLGNIGSEGNEFIISLDTDPRAVKILTEFSDSNEDRYLLKNELDAHCKLITDFGDAIYFYTPEEKYGMFSNFSEHGITIKEIFYPTVEHYYQASKFENMEYKELIRKSNSPKRASELGKSKEQTIKSNWNDIKIDVMTEAIRLKFNQNTNIKATLLTTNNKLLIENSPYDNFWGIGRTGVGINYLGTILMRIRKEIITTA